MNWNLFVQIWSDTVWGQQQEPNDGDKGTIWMGFDATMFRENILHAFLKQVWYIREEGFKSKKQYFIGKRKNHLFVWFLIPFVLFCRCLLMLASGSKIISLYRRANKRLNTHMSKNELTSIGIFFEWRISNRSETSYKKKHIQYNAKLQQTNCHWLGYAHSWPQLVSIGASINLLFLSRLNVKTKLDQFANCVTYRPAWFVLSHLFQVCEEEIRGVVFSEHCTGSCWSGVQDLPDHCTWSEACEEDFQACRRDIEAPKSLRGRLVVTPKWSVTSSGKYRKRSMREICVFRTTSHQIFEQLWFLDFYSHWF